MGKITQEKAAEIAKAVSEKLGVHEETATKKIFHGQDDIEIFLKILECENFEELVTAARKAVSPALKEMAWTKACTIANPNQVLEVVEETKHMTVAKQWLPMTMALFKEAINQGLVEVEIEHSH